MLTITSWVMKHIREKRMPLNRLTNKMKSRHPWMFVMRFLHLVMDVIVINESVTGKTGLF